MRRSGPVFLVLAVAIAAPIIALGQEQGAEERRGRRRAEVARLFDEYAIAQARDELGLDAAQVEPFGRRFGALQEARRRHLTARRALVRDLALLIRQEPPPADEALRKRLAGIDEEDRRAREEIGRAESELDEVLTLPQRARFRVFEEELERKKLELMMRARRGPRRQSVP
jgi:hypothetical protein